MLDWPLLLIFIIVVALIFDYTNGAHDCANAIAGVISTRVLSPVAAVTMAAVLNLIGALLGTEVALTIGGGIVPPGLVKGCHGLVLAALLGAIGWNLLTWYLGLPSSSSHGLIGGLAGAGIAYQGWATPNYATIYHKVILPLVLSPLGGFIGGYLLMLSLAWLCVRMRPGRANSVFRKLQLLASGLMALSHGTNDAQKTMGLITLALFIFHRIPALEVPRWVVWACALTMALGTATGGWKIIKTMGHKIFKMEPIHGFASATASTLVINLASAFGAPISTTQTISTSVMGAGAVKRFSAVHWGVAGHMIIAWVLTIPAAAALGALFMNILGWLGLGR